MRKLLKIIFIACLVFALVLLVLMIDASPSVQAQSSKQVQSAESVQRLLNEIRQSLRDRNQAQTIKIDSDQADSLAGFIQRALGKASAQVIFNKPEVHLKASYELNIWFTSLYLNIKVIIPESDSFKIERLVIGDLPIPGGFALSSAEYFANSYTSSKVASKAIETVESVKVEENAVLINLAPIDGLLKEFKNTNTGSGSDDNKALKIRIAHYLRVLSALDISSSSTNNSLSLSFYLQALFEEASALSQTNPARLENEAAILALAIYAGNHRFKNLVGDLSFTIDTIPLAKIKPVLLDRQDLSLHFIYSAAIKLLSQKEFSIAVGEFKELMDRAKGGSGYSFVDLAADMSGAHFAELATNAQSAAHIQNVLKSEANERLFMISVNSLEEGLSKQAFIDKYTEVDSPKYKEVVAEIERRLSRLAITNHKLGDNLK